MWLPFSDFSATARHNQRLLRSLAFTLTNGEVWLFGVVDAEKKACFRTTEVKVGMGDIKYVDASTLRALMTLIMIWVNTSIFRTNLFCFWRLRRVHRQGRFSRRPCSVLRTAAELYHLYSQALRNWLVSYFHWCDVYIYDLWCYTTGNLHVFRIIVLHRV